MRLFQRRGLSARLTLAAVFVCAGLAGAAAFTMHKLNEVSDLSQRTGHHRIPQLAEVAQVELNVTRASLQLRHAMLARNEAERETALKDVLVKRQVIDTLLKQYEERLFTEAGKKRFQPVPAVLQSFWEQGEANIRLIQNGQREEAFAYLVDHTIPARNALLKVLSETVSYQQQSTEDDIARIESGIKQTLAVLMAVFLMIALAMIGLSWWIGNSLRQRVQRSQEVAERVRDGDLSTQIKDESNDEFSPLLMTLSDMQSSLTRVVTKVRGNADAVATASA